MTNATHIMLDLETWGKRPGFDIRSIGAIVFDPVAGTVLTNGWRGADLLKNTFYIATDNPTGRMRFGHWEPESVLMYDDERYRKYPLTRDPETVKWWNDQSPEAQAAFANPVDLRRGLELFHMWLEEVLTSDALIQSHEDQSLRLWANGPQFDVSILEAVYHAVGLPVPWYYRAPRDFRTITDAAGMTRDDFKAFEHGTAHNALDDATSQAMIVCEAYKRLRLVR